MRTHGRWSRIIFLVLVVGFLQGPLQQARGDGFVITGTVRDAVGVALAGATVSDGRQNVTTDSAGRYELVETNLATYYVNASKGGYVEQTRQVSTATNTEDVDFDLSFVISAPISPKYFNDVPTTITVSALSLAPADTVVVTVLPDSTSVNLTYSGQSGNQNSWEGAFSVPLSASDGIYQVRTSGTRSGVAITSTSLVHYYLDRVNPALGSPRVSPFSNDPLTAHSSRPTLSVSASDDRAGIDPATIVAEIWDSIGDLVATGPGAFSEGRASFTLPVSLSDGSYSAALTVRDRADNKASTTFTFIVDTESPRFDSRPYTLGAFSGLTMLPSQMEDAVGIGEHQCTKNQRNGACFVVAPHEESGAILIADATGRPVGAWFQMLKCNTSVTSCSQLSDLEFCGSTTAEIPHGSTHLQISLGFTYGQTDCPDAGSGYAGPHPGTWGTIDVAFYAPSS